MVEFEFSIFGGGFRVITDEPTATRNALRMVLGVEDASEVEAGEPRPPVLILSRETALGLNFDNRVNLDGVEVEMDSGAEIWLVRLPGDERLMLRNILHAVAAWARRRFMKNGIFTLHASGVTGRGGAVAFAGGNDTGKTTLQTMFVRAGWDFLADDNLPLSFGGGRMKALFIGEAISGARFAARELDTLIARGYRTFGYPGFLTAPRVDAPADLKAIFFLERGDEIEELTPAAAAVKIMNLCKAPLLDKNDYGGYFDFAAKCASGARCATLRFEPEKAGGEVVEKIARRLESWK